MSKTIDERVVSMEFDNSKFEKNVATSMSTIDKLKAKLNFKGASDSLDSINKAANKVDISSLGSSVEKVQMKFSALQVAGITALTNITNSAVNAGKRIISALTIDPISDGFEEYEMTLNTVQTTMAGTGKTAKEVEKELKKLDEYADLTVYSSADMFNNLPKFTNAGVELSKATTAMIGIANATALAGGGANQASIAFYNLGQAIGTGYLTRMDYNSINNAGIATMEWKEQMVEAAIAQGTLTKVGEDSYKAGKKTYTLQQLFIDGLQTQWATTDVMMKVFGDYGNAETEIGKKAYAAAQDVKTFSMMMESLKATAGTGWKDTWQIIFGDLDEAKELWTGLTNFISGIIGKISDLRNNFLTKALRTSYNPFSDLLDKIDKTGIGKFTKKVDSISKSLEYYQKVVTAVWRGDYNNQPYRYGLLEKAGYDNPRLIQSLVNKGYQYKLTVDDIAEAEKKYGKTTKKTSEAVDETAASIEKLTDKQLKKKGFTSEEIKMLRQLQKQSKQTGKSISELVEEMNSADGRTLLIESFKNIGKSLTSVGKNAGKAWKSIFPDSMTSLAFNLYNIIKGFNDFSKTLLVNKEKAGELRRTFKGLFAALDIVSTLTSGPLKIGFKVLKSVLSVFNLDILDVTAKVGDAIVKFDKWLNSILDFESIIETVSPYISTFAKSIKEGFNDFKESDFVQTGKKLVDGIITGIKTKASEIWNTITGYLSDMSGFSEAKAAGENTVAGYIEGLKGRTGSVWNSVLEFGTKILSTICEVLGIHSPSTEFKKIGEYSIDGFVEGLQNGASKIWEKVKEIANKCIDFFKNRNWGSIFAVGTSAGLLIIIKELVGALQTLGGPLEGVGSLMDGAGKVLKKSARGINKVLKSTAKVIKSFSKVLKGFAFKKTAEGLKDIAIAIAILVGSIIALTFVDSNKLWESVKVIGALAGILAALAIVISLMSKSSAKIGKNGINIDGIKTSLLGIAAAILLVAVAVKLIGSMGPDQAKQGFEGLAGVVIALGVVIGAFGLLVKGKSAQNVDKLGSMLTKMSVALLLMVVAVKLLGRMNPDELKQGGIAIAAFVGVVALLTKIAQKSGKNMDKLGSMLIKMSAALLLMVVAVKLIGRMESGELLKGGIAIAAFVGVVALLTKIAQKYGAQEFSKVGSTLLAMSGSILIMALIVKMLGDMSLGQILKGGLAIAGFVVIINALVKIIQGIGSEAPKIAGTLLAMSVSIGILAAIAILLGMMPLENLAKGIIAVGLLGAIMTAMIWATRGASDCKGNLIVMTVAIGIMAAAVAALSFIDPTRLAGATAALGILMGIFALMTLSASKAQASIGPLIVLTVAVGMIAGVLYLLASLPIENTISAAVSLGAVLLAMSVALGVSGLLGTNALLGAAAIAIVAVVLLGLVGIIALMNELDMAKSIISATVLSGFLLAMSGALVILGVVGLMGPAAFIGIGALITLMASLAVLMGVIGALVDKNPKLQTFVEKSIPFLEALGTGLGSFVGGFIGGVLGSMSNALPKIGDNLTLFWESVEPFINGVKNVDQTVIDGVSNLCKAFLALTGTSLIDKLVGWFTGGNDFTKIGEQLVTFGEAMCEFSTKVEGINVEAINASATAATGLSNLLKNMPSTGGLWQKIAGEKSWDTLTDGLVAFGVTIVAYGSAVSLLKKEQIDAISRSVEGGKALTELQAEIPSAGGFWQKITGEKNWSTITDGLISFGSSLIAYGTTVAGLTSEHTNAIGTSITAAKSLSELQNNLPNSGGLFQKWFGSNTWSGLSDGLIDFGEDIVEYSSKVSKINVEALDTSITAAQKLSVLIDSLPKKSLWEKFTKDSPLSELGENLVDFGEKLSTFSTKLSNVNTDKMSATTTFISGLKSVASGGIKGFNDSIANSSSDVKTTIENMLKTVAKNLADDPGGKFSIKGSKLIKSFISGMKEKTEDAKTRAENIAISASKAAGKKSNYNLFYNAGKYLVEGFAAGISANTWKATAKARAMAKAAAEAAKNELDINSPSKVFYKIGAFSGMGFVNALDDYGAKSEKASEDMAGLAMKGLKGAISKVRNLIENGMDTQPTIRPVVDLTDVREGADSINSMFSVSRTMRLSTANTDLNVSSISGLMNRRQNGSAEVVDAVKSLKKSVSNLKPGNSYSINGITYDDGSNVAKAIETLIREVSIERRS